MTEPPALPSTTPPKMPPTPQPVSARQVIAFLVVIALPLAVGTVQQGVWTMPHNVYGGIGLGMMLPFLLFNLAVDLGVVVAITTAMVALGRFRGYAVIGLFAYALGLSTLAFFAVIDCYSRRRSPIDRAPTRTERGRVALGVSVAVLIEKIVKGCIQ